MIFIDSNVPMYLVGAPHPHKVDTIKILEGLTAEKRRLVTSVEVLQEILHRYCAIGKREAIQPTFDRMYEFIDAVFDVTEKDILGAKDLLLIYKTLSARDAIHAAQMKRLKIDTIFSFDRAFDQLPGIKRIPQ